MEYTERTTDGTAENTASEKIRQIDVLSAYRLLAVHGYEAGKRHVGRDVEQ